MDRLINLNDKERQDIIEHCSSALAKKVENAGKSITRRSAKQKGMKFQLEICEALSKTLNISFNNQEDDSPLASRPSGQNGEDIILRGEAKKRLPFSFECKSVESLSIAPTVQQAKANAKDKDWIICHRKKTMKEDIVIMALETFLKMLKKGNY